MGLMQREKGKRFERDVAAELRRQWPESTVRRASQAERAHESDVFIAGGPPILSRLWLEIQDARVPVPKTKLCQAERDVYRFHGGMSLDEITTPRLPVVVWHRLGERTIWVTTRLWVLLELVSSARAHVRDLEMVTTDLPGFIAVLRRTEAA